ncbi:phosphate acetyltransferase [Leptodesmis sichuanensis]|uniref:phosphate acetyltransferase n=1 Tax=Leptodesmis sichuanensis TaxID=2906798 RepID=UPI001F43A6AF|nr:phosphate acetyltransferase [Leptodesmis sichuanensis]UIE38376.1 phosphate acetyltransferase [Leptodesmis sichuanensis A121]
MLKNLYIAAIEPSSGKSLVLLGLMELLSKRVPRLGFFRPVIHDGHRADNDIELVSSRYTPGFPYTAYFGMTHTRARRLIADGQFDELLQEVIEKYKSLERQCDFVVCEGVNPTDIDPALVDNFDTQMANHLAAPILAIANADGKTIEEIIANVRTEHEAYLAAGCTVMATIVNRVAAAQVNLVRERLESLWPGDKLVFVLPEEPLLTQPTIAEISQALNANLVYGDQEQLNREVSGCKVAAMEVPNFLTWIQEGNLVITPGDRADIVLACFASSLSNHSPSVSGIVLTGGLALAPALKQLMEGLSRWNIPILSVETDTYTTTQQVNTVRADIRPDNQRKIASALGVFESNVDTAKLAERITVSHCDRMTPFLFEYELIEQARAQKQHIVLPEGTDERILRAAEILLRRRVVDITLLGNVQKIREAIAALDVKLDGANLIDPVQSDQFEDYARTYYELRKHKGITQDYAYDVMRDVSYFGTMMVYKDVADGMVSGALHTTAHTIRPALEFIRPVPGCSIVSSVFFMCLEDRVLVYGDCAVNPNPTAEQLADIAISSAQTAQTFGIEPRIAMLSYSTGDSGQGEDVDKVKTATRRVQELRPDLKIAGPIQYDAAVDESVARTKLPNNEVAGHATVFIFPDLNTGNNTYKAVQRSANAVAIGPVLQGLKKPVNDLSRGCTVPDIVNTVAITAIQAQAVKQGGY